MKRTETRKERYEAKSSNAKSYNVRVATTHFSVPGNVAYIARALACFGGRTLEIIGNRPQASELKRLSGGMSELIEIKTHSNVYAFLDYCRARNLYLIAAELGDKSKSILDFTFPLDKDIVLVIGNEMEGIPVDILQNVNDMVYIPMDGKGFCLNASQTANVLLYEYIRQVHLNAT